MRRSDNLRCRLFRNSGSLNLLEPSGPVQTCAGIALPFGRHAVFVTCLAIWSSPEDTNRLFRTAARPFHMCVCNQNGALRSFAFNYSLFEKLQYAAEKTDANFCVMHCGGDHFFICSNTFCMNSLLAKSTPFVSKLQVLHLCSSPKL